MTTGEQPEWNPDDLDVEPGVESDPHDAHDVEPDANPVRARAKRLAVWGAVTLWIVSPLFIGAFITTAVHVADHGGAHGLAMVGFVVWAFACFVVMSLGFLMLMGGVYLWWRSRNPVPLTARGPADERRAAVLRELQEELRAQDVQPGADDSARP